MFFGRVGFLGGCFFNCFLLWAFFLFFFFKSHCLTLTGQMDSHKMPLFFKKGIIFSVQIHLSDLKSGISQTAGRKLVRINLAASSVI